MTVTTTRRIGHDGPQVTAIGLGCMSFAGFYGETDRAESRQTLAKALELGIDHLDTSNMYGDGLSEEVIGEFIKDNPNRFTIATKAGIISGPPRRFDNSAAHLRGELEKSLRRLGVEQVALYYIHRRDPSIEIEDVMETMVRFKEEGKIGAIGLSEVSPSTLRRASAVHPVAAVQNEYSLWTRLPELGLVQACGELGTTLVAFSPLARGMFADKAPDPSHFSDRDFRARNPRFMEPNFSANLAYFDRFRDLARQMGHSPAALAIAWVLSRGAHVLPIPGTRSAAHLEEDAKALDIELASSDIDAIDKVMPIGFAWGDRYSDQQSVGPERYC